MNRVRLGLALIAMAGCASVAQAAPICASQSEVLYRLAPALATHDPARLTMAFRAMGDYGLPAADIVETLVNALGYERLEQDEIDAAIEVFELNSETFPDSANAWDSLAEATMAAGRNELAIRYYQRSLEIDPDNRNAARMIEQFSFDTQLSHAVGF